MVVVDAAGVVEVVVWLPALVTTYVPAEARNARREHCARDKAGAGGGAPSRRSATLAGAGSAAGGVSGTGCAAGAAVVGHRHSVRLRLQFSGGG